MMPLARGRENADSGVFFTVPSRVAMNTKCVVVVLLDGQHGGDLLALLQRQQVHHRLAARSAAGLRQLEHAQPVHLAAIREAQQRVVRVRDEQLLDEVFVLDGRGALAAAAAALRLVVGHRLRLGITRCARA